MAPIGLVQEWISIKSAIQSWAGIDSGAAHILASLFVLIGFAALLRRPLWSFIPWFAVLCLELANEAATRLADGTIEEWELAGSLRDVMLVMAVPTILLLLCRLAPRLVAPPPPPLRATRAPSRRGDTIIDAEFEELA